MAMTPLTTAQAERINRRTGTAVELQAGSRIKELEERATALEGIDTAADPCLAVGYLGNRTIAGVNALTPAKGDVVVATDSGTPTAGASDALTAGDVAEYDGTQWQKLLDGVGGFVPDGTVLLVQAPLALFSPLTTTTDNGKVCTFDGTTNTPIETVPTDGDRRTVKGEESVNENDAFTYDASSTSWVRAAPGLSDAAPAAVAEAGSAGDSLDAPRANHVHAHGNQGTYAGSLHDADQVDWERTDALKARVQSGSDTVEAALTDLDDALASVLVRGYRGGATIAGLDLPLAGLATGDVVVLTDAGTPAAGGTSDAGTIGSVMEYDGTAWQEILAPSGGFVPAGTRLIVSGGALLAPITEAADENKIALFSGASNTPTLRSPVDGEVRLVKGETSTEENQFLVYDAGSTAWTVTTLQALTDHTNGGASKHDLTETDYERADALKARIASGSDTGEAAITDLDDALAPVALRGYIGTRTIVELDDGGFAEVTGESVVAGGAGTPAIGASDVLAIGDVAEFDGTQWKKRISNSGGFVPAGTRLVASGGDLFAPLTDATDENKVALFDGTSNTPTLKSPTDGEARVVKGASVIEQGRAIVFRTGTGWALQKTAAADTTFADTDSTFAATDVEAAIAEARNTLRTRASVAVLLTAGGDLVVSRSSMLADTFAAAASDDLESFSGMETGQLLVLGIADAGRNIVIKHAGTIKCPGGLDVTLDAAADMALVFYDGVSHHILGVSLAAQPAVGTSTVVTNAGAGDAGKLLALDGAGKAAGRVLETDGAKLDAIDADGVALWSSRNAADSDVTENGVAAAVETDFTALSIPSATINVARRTIRFRALVAQLGQNAADTTRVRVYYGTILISDGTALASAAGKAHWIEGFIQMVGTGANADFKSHVALTEDTTPATVQKFNGTPGVDKVDATAPVPLKVTVEHSTNNATNSTRLAALEADVYAA